MSRLTRDGTAEPVSRDQILRHARGQGNIHFPCSADHEQDWQPYPVDPYSAICDDHTYIHTYIGMKAIAATVVNDVEPLLSTPTIYVDVAKVNAIEHRILWSAVTPSHGAIAWERIVDVLAGRGLRTRLLHRIHELWCWAPGRHSKFMPYFMRRRAQRWHFDERSWL